MVSYRNFYNFDPPKILDLWNRSTHSRGFGKLSGCDRLEQLIFAKPYFDRYGLLLAFDGELLVGMCHAGFGCNESQSQLENSMGAVCMLLVDPSYRRKGIGSELLTHAQAYLRNHGATVQYAGAIYPLNPFYLGLYGGSEMPGILESDAEATEFVTHRGYTVADTSLVYQRTLTDLDSIEDSRIPLLRRQVNLQVEGWPKPLSWWQACTLGPMVSLRYEMTSREDNRPIALAWVWEMDAFGQASATPTVGVTNIFVEQDLRGQGYGKLLVHSILKHLEEQKIHLVEVQTMERNTAAQQLYLKLGFELVDCGHVYRLDKS